MSKFADKTVLITGASSGIGKAFAIKIASEKPILILSARNIDKLQEVKTECENLGATCHVIPADVTRKEEIKALFLKAQQIGKIDLVFNNAGLGYIANIKDLKADEIETMIDINVKGMIMVTKYAVEVMTRQNFGHIIMTSSLAGFVTLPQWSVYNATKWAIRGFANSIRPELKQFNVKVSTLHPGPVDTEFFDKGKADIDLSKLGQAISVDVVANTLYNMAFSNKKEVLVPFSSKVYAWLFRHFTSIGEMLVNKLASKLEYHKDIQEDEPEFDQK